MGATVSPRSDDFSRVLFRGNMRSETAAPLVGIVDDDESVCDSISSLLRSAGYGTAVFASADAFLSSEYVRDGNDMVLLLDICMPGLSGLELQHRLSDLNCSIPIIFLSAAEDDGIRATALKNGAFAFFSKPFSDASVLGAIGLALERPNHKR